jgi:hypothetical protein
MAKRDTDSHGCSHSSMKNSPKRWQAPHDVSGCMPALLVLNIELQDIVF